MKKNICNSSYQRKSQSMGNDDQIFIRIYCSQNSGSSLVADTCNNYYKILYADYEFYLLWSTYAEHPSLFLFRNGDLMEF